MDLTAYSRLAVLTGSSLGPFTSKTAAGVIRYRPKDVVAVIDWAHAGQPMETVLGYGQGIPIVADFAAAQAYRPDAVLIGLAPMGGQLDADLRVVVRDALEAGVAVISGLHMLLREDPEFGPVAARTGAAILDVRDATDFQVCATAKARHLKVKRVLMIGTDCAIGKMWTALELTAAAQRTGLDAAFVPTGQTGIMVAGWGISVDRVISDFTAGAAEWLVEQVGQRQICFVEGQGSIEHPAYSGVTLSLMHGCCPEAMVMCHRPDRIFHRHLSDVRVTDICKQIRMCEELASCVHPAKVAAVSVNTARMGEDEACSQIERIGRETGLPTTDPVRFGADGLLPAIRAAAGV